MNPTPFLAKASKIGRERSFDPIHVRDRKTIVLTQFKRSMRAVKVKQRLLASANYVNVGWAMIIGVNHHTERSDSRYDRYCTTEPKRLGLLKNEELGLVQLCCDQIVP